MPIFMEEGDTKTKALKDLYETHFPAYMESLSSKCLGETKFICGENLTIYDFYVGGLFVNNVHNPQGRLHAGLLKVYNEKAPERLKKYISDFQQEMKPYLDKRT